MACMAGYLSLNGRISSHFHNQKSKVKVLPAPMAHRAAPISVSVALGHTSANAVKDTSGGGLVHW